MAASKYPREKALTPAQQGYFLKISFPQFQVIAARHELRCIGTLQPSVTSNTYTISLEYVVPERPRVRVVRPDLTLASGREKLPHVFRGNDLCLHVRGEWRPDLKISEHIIPWISFWLEFYETWLVTGEWLGGGHEPAAGKK